MGRFRKGLATGKKAKEITKVAAEQDAMLARLARYDRASPFAVEASPRHAMPVGSEDYGVDPARKVPQRGTMRASPSSASRRRTL